MKQDVRRGKEVTQKPMRHLDASVITGLGEKYQPKETVIPCTGNAIRLGVGDGAVGMTDHEIMDILRKDRESAGIDRLPLKQRKTLVELRIKLSKDGAGSFTPQERMWLQRSIRPVQEAVNPEERQRRDTRVAAFLAFYDGKRCNEGVLNDFFTREAIETLVSDASEVLGPYGVGEEKARGFAHRCGRCFLENCRAIIDEGFETGQITRSNLARTLFARYLNPKHMLYFLDYIHFGTEERFGFSGIPELLGRELKNMTKKDPEDIEGKLETVQFPTSLYALHITAFNPGRGGSTGNR